MKSIRRIAAFFALLSLTGLHPVLATTGTVVVINNTSYNIYEVYASNSSAPSWDTTSNLLGSLIIVPGQTITLTIPVIAGTGGCREDLMAVLYGSDQYAYQYSVDVCTGVTWTLTNS